MTVKEALDLLAYGTAYEIRGAYSGKIYHRSWINSSKNLDKYAFESVTDNPFYTTMIIHGKAMTNEWCAPVIGIWMSDYYLVNKKEGDADADCD